MTKRTAILLSAFPGALLAFAGPARAELPERVSPLADAPAVRHRVELREKRFEIGPGVTTTVGQDFYHAVLVGGRLSIHLTDWMAFGAMGAFNVLPNLRTPLTKQLTDPQGGVLPGDMETVTDRTPRKGEALLGMNRIGWTAAGQLELSPFSGKYSLFGKLFANYDLYGFGGLGVINFVSDAGGDDPARCAMVGRSCAVTGLKVGPTFGVGIHTFFGDMVSLNLEFRDVLLRNNPAGRDETGDGIANDEDLSWDSNYMVGLNITLFLPGDAQKSD